MCHHHEAEPPKLYDPHAPVIVPKSSDGYAYAPDNLRSLSGVLKKPKSSTFYNSHRINRGVTTTLYICYKTLHQSAEEFKTIFYISETSYFYNLTLIAEVE
jgi:hypothetical protein